MKSIYLSKVTIDNFEDCPCPDPDCKDGYFEYEVIVEEGCWEYFYDECGVFIKAEYTPPIYGIELIDCPTCLSGVVECDEDISFEVCYCDSYETGSGYTPCQCTAVPFESCSCFGADDEITCKIKCRCHPGN